VTFDVRCGLVANLTISGALAVAARVLRDRKTHFGLTTLLMLVPSLSWRSITLHQNTAHTKHVCFPHLRLLPVVARHVLAPRPSEAIVTFAAVVWRRGAGRAAWRVSYDLHTVAREHR
jgi:hypothetical protein